MILEENVSGRLFEKEWLTILYFLIQTNFLNSIFRPDFISLQPKVELDKNVY